MIRLWLATKLSMYRNTPVRHFVSAANNPVSKIWHKVPIFKVDMKKYFLPNSSQSLCEY